MLAVSWGQLFVDRPSFYDFPHLIGMFIVAYVSTMIIGAVSGVRRGDIKLNRAVFGYVIYAIGIALYVSGWYFFPALIIVSAYKLNIAHIQLTASTYVPEFFEPAAYLALFFSIVGNFADFSSTVGRNKPAPHLIFFVILIGPLYVAALAVAGIISILLSSTGWFDGAYIRSFFQIFRLPSYTASATADAIVILAVVLAAGVISWFLRQSRLRANA